MANENKDLALAYGMARRKKKYAQGGEVTDETSEGEPVFPGPSRTSRYAEGGMIEMKQGSIADAIMRKRAPEPEPTDDDLSFEGDLKENDDEDLTHVDEPAPGAKQDIVGEIMKSMKAARK